MNDRVVYSRTYEAMYTGKGEFYTGLRPGDLVEVVEETVVYSFDGKRHSVVNLSCHKPGGAWMSLNGLDNLGVAS
jgi:hypothetical protein